MRVWVRLDDYKAWCDTIDDYGTGLCYECPFEIQDTAIVQSDFRGTDVIRVLQNCGHRKCRLGAYIPLQFIELAEYDNYSFSD
jgi:hypothetical protein